MFEVYDEDGERFIPEVLLHAPQTLGAAKKKPKKRRKPRVDENGKPILGRPPLDPALKKPKKKPKKVGRPKMNLTPEPVSEDFKIHLNDKYEPWMCRKIIEVAMGGGFQAAMIMACGISSEKTLYNWMDRHPEFADAYHFASKICSKAFLEKIAVDAAMGKIEKCNSTALALLMNNKFPEEYRRSGSDGALNVTVNTVNLTAGQMDTQIAQKMEKLAALGISWEGLLPNKTNEVVEAEYTTDEGAPE